MAKRHRGIVLCELIESEKVKKFVEVGVNNGKLAYFILNSCRNKLTEYWAIDQWGLLPEYDQIEGNLEKWQRKYQRVASLMLCFPQLRVLRLESVTAAKLFPKEYFDLVFIDADHSYESVRRDIKSWLPRVRKGGIISGHDYASGKFPDCTKAVNECLGKGNINRDSDKTWWVKKLKNGLKAL